MNEYQKISLLLEAIISQDLEKIKKALENKPDIKENISKVFDVAEKINNKEIMRLILPHALNNSSNSSVNNGELFIRATINNDIDTIKYLLENNTDIHVRNDTGIRTSASKGHLELVKFFVKKGVGLSVQDYEPLRSAVSNGHTSVVDYILKECKQNIRVHEIAIEAAIGSEQKEMLEHLLQKRIELKYEMPELPKNISDEMRKWINSKFLSLELGNDLNSNELKAKKIKL